MSHTFRIERLVILASLRRGLLLVRARYLTLLGVGALPLALMLAGAACDVLVQADTAAQGSLHDASALLLFVLLGVRLFAIGMLCASWSWYCGAAMIEEQPEIGEAIRMGCRFALRSILACLPVWMIGLALVALTLMAGRVMILIFAPVGWAAVLLALLLLASLVTLPLLALLARFCMLVQVTLFDAAPPFDALRRSGGYLPWRAVWYHWWPLWLVGLALLACVFAPACLMTQTTWALLGAGTVSVPHELLRQGLAAGGLWLAGPLAFALIAPLYFSQRPDLFTSAAQTP